MNHAAPPPGSPHRGSYAPQGGPRTPQPRSGLPIWAILLIVGFGAVMVLGMLAAIAVPAFVKYQRRAKAIEAKVQLAKIYDGVASYYRENESCPSDGQPAGQTGPTPPLSVNCNEGPGGMCVPGSGPGSEANYSAKAWKHPVWDQIGYLQEQGHAFHYNFIWASDPSTGACQFTVQAFADLDDDGVFSTYERYGAGDVSGVNSALGLYIDREAE